MQTTPDIDKQHTIIGNLKTLKLEEGEACVISYKWYDLWAKADKEMDVPEINNSGLADQYGVKENLSNNEDYKIISKNEWNILHDWYRGGPEIKITLFRSPHTDKIVPSVRKFRYLVYLTARTTTIVSEFTISVKELKEKACEAFKVDPSKYVLSFSHEGKLGDDLFDSNFLFEIPHSTTFALKKILKNTRLVKSKSFSDIASCGNEGVCGLYNLGETCYFNAVIQCLIHTMPFVSFMESGEWKQMISETDVDGMQGRTIHSLFEIVDNVWNGKGAAFNPQALRNCIADKFEAFAGQEHNDSHKLLLFLIGLLNDEINKCENKTPLALRDGDGTNDDEIAEDSLKQIKERSGTPIFDIFSGLRRTKTVCSDCKKESVKFDSFFTLSVPLSYIAKLSPMIHFIPLNPKEPKTVLKITLEENETIETVSASISPIVGRKVNVVLARSQEVGKILKFIADPNEMESTYIYYAFEVDPTKFYAITYPCYNQIAAIGTNPEILSQPALIELPAANAKAEDLEPILEEHFSYLFEVEEVDGEKPKVSKALQKILNESEEFKDHPDKRIVAVLEKHLFSKTMRFKPDPAAPCIAKRRVYAVINKSVMSDPSRFDFKKLSARSNRTSEAGQPSMTLSSCMEKYISETALDDDCQWICPSCKQHVTPTRTLSIWMPPKILIIHLKRFFKARRGSFKCDAMIEYPDVLDIAPYLSRPAEKTKYKLYAVINHIGTSTSDNYNACAIVNEKWYEFNDSQVKECDEDAFHSRHAYILFYQLIEN